MPDNNLSIVHDHYKETFTIVREREHDRDRSFLLLIGLFALLVIEVYYPAAVGGTVRSVQVLGTDIDLSHMPLSMLLNATWVLVLAVSLSYCRVAISIDRQYPYVHHLENWISDQLGDDTIYRREGSVYLERYPVLLNWAWFCYVVVFPLVVALVTILLLQRESAGLPYSVIHKGFDALIGILVVISFLLYRVLPKVLDKLPRNQN
jgi:hypothetical protein